ncbi:MAG: NAD(P)/FAD-dependent oxidoreductase [Rickettsiales bacterium]|nr:NAD(P)/FAD-dependent oxidoreductase [Rickettsiales bacterium]
MKHYDAIIIGAGAAGLMCAAVASKRGRKVLLIEHSQKIGEKIRISGGGRCNFTNIHTTPKNFISQNPHFAVSALQRFTAEDFIAMVEKHQIAFHEKTLGQLFCDFSSQQIIDMLLRECKDGGVEILLETLAKNIKEIEKKSQSDNLNLEASGPSHLADKGLNAATENISHRNFTLKIENKNADEALTEQVSCQSLIIATGGLSIPKMGATSFGYDIARKFGVKIIEPFPALVPLTLDKSTLEVSKNLAGVAVEAIVSCAIESDLASFTSASANFTISPQPAASFGNKGAIARIISFREAILFTHRGLSGPAILQISSYLQKGQEITINMAPDHNIYDILIVEKKQKPKQEIITILNKYLPKSLASYILQNHLNTDKKSSLEPLPQNSAVWIADISNQKLQEIANRINAFKLQPEGTEGYAKAEVTAGGVDTNEISSKTFECKSVQGLYFIGELLDVTGHLGGFNFQWAWSCGHAAGEAV